MELPKRVELHQDDFLPGNWGAVEIQERINGIISYLESQKGGGTAQQLCR